MDLKQLVLGGILWSGAGRLMGQLITWLITIIVMRLLTPTDYGLMALAGIFIGFLGILNEIGLGGVIIQRQMKNEVQIRTILGILLLTNLSAFFILLGSAHVIGSYFGEARLAWIIRISSLGLIIAPFGIIPQSLLDKDFKFGQRSAADFVSSLSGGLVTLILAKRGFGVWSLVWGNLAMGVGRVVALNMCCKWVKVPLLSLKMNKGDLSFGGYLTGERLLWYFYTQADIFIIGKLLGRETLGLYSIAANLASIPMDKISGILNQVGMPAYSIIQNDFERVGSYFLKTIRLISILSFPILWGMSSIGSDIILIVLGEKWRAAILPFQLLTVIIPFRMISSLMAPAVMGVGRADISFKNVLLASIVMTLSFYLGSFFGIIGVCLGWIIVYPIVTAANLFRVSIVLKLKMRHIAGSISRPFWAAIIMYCGTAIYRVNSKSLEGTSERLIAEITIGAVLYLISILVLDRKIVCEIFGMLTYKGSKHRLGKGP